MTELYSHKLWGKKFFSFTKYVLEVINDKAVLHSCASAIKSGSFTRLSWECDKHVPKASCGTYYYEQSAITFSVCLGTFVQILPPLYASWYVLTGEVAPTKKSAKYKF